jgi:hypothetical protein
MFHSGNEFPIREMKNDLRLTNFECTRDSHGNNFTFFETSAPKRVNQILHAFQEFNRNYPSRAIQIEGGLGLDSPIETFSIRDNYKQHHVYLKIKSAEAAKQSGLDVSYKIWTPAIQKQLDRDQEIARQEEDLNVQEAVMDEDPSAFNIQASDQEETDPDDSEDEEISVNHASVGARLVENEVAQQLPGIQTVEISSIGSNESLSIEMVQMENAKLARENAKLTGENNDLKAQIRIERLEVMQELRMMEIRMMEMNENSTRAEKRFAEHMGIQDQPLGNPSDNYPYSQWTDELRDEFSVKLKKNYEGAARLVKRKDLPPLEDFPDAAKSRLFQIGLGVVLSTPGNAFNLENSPSKHRYDLVKLSGSIFDVNTAAKIRASLDIQEKYWCNKLSKPYVENRKVYPLMEGDAFLSPDVSL